MFLWERFLSSERSNAAETFDKTYYAAYYNASDAVLVEQAKLYYNQGTREFSITYPNSIRLN